MRIEQTTSRAGLRDVRLFKDGAMTHTQVKVDYLGPGESKTWVDAVAGGAAGRCRNL